MPAVNFYFQIHQPYRLRRYTVFDLGQNSFYEDDDRNCDMLLYAARACYLPMNDVLLKCIAKHGKAFKVSFSISGIALEQFEQYAPEVIESFQALAATGCVEFLGETYSHSLACIYSKDEFARQIALHSAKIHHLFGKKPRVFRNTELIYNNDVAATVEALGFAGVLAEGADHVLGWRSPNYVYTPQGCSKIKLLLNNYPMSDNISVNFGKHDWDQWPLTAEKYAAWCHELSDSADLLNIFMNYETFGLTHKADTGIFAFMEHLPDALLADKRCQCTTVSEALAKYDAVGSMDVPMYMSWCDAERDLNIWLGNDMQKDAIHALYELEPLAQPKHGDLHQTWLRLQTADHFAYMCTKWFSNDAHSAVRSNPYNSPYDAYINYMNVLADYTLLLKERTPAPKKPATAKKTTASTASKTAGTKATSKASPATAPAGEKKASAAPKATKVDKSTPSGTTPGKEPKTAGAADTPVKPTRGGWYNDIGNNA